MFHDHIDFFQVIVLTENKMSLPHEDKYKTGKKNEGNS